MSIDFPKEEEVVLQRWREINAFHRQVSYFLSRHPLVLWQWKSNIGVVGGTI
jgi:isoleucyl-tRNA synthetase